MTTTTTTPQTVRSDAAATPATLSLPRIMLHLEGLAVLIAASVLYAHQRWSGITFAALFLVPDLTFFAFLAGKTVGARVYNVMHFYAMPVTLLVIGILADSPTAMQIAAIWFAHIGMDRAVGYGLKYSTDFADTHLKRA